MQLVHSPRWRQALAAEPHHPWLANELANGLWLDDALPEALSWARWATREHARAVHPLAWRTLGNVLLDLGRYGEADLAYQRADPAGSDPATQFNRSKAQLGLGDWGLAWKLAEQRLQLNPLPDGVISGPWWQGWPQVTLITLWSEQGLGDSLQFVRWLPALLARVPRVELLVEQPLQRLLEQGLAWMGPGLQVREHPEAGVALQGCHGSLLSLPWRLAEPEPPRFGPQGYLRLPTVRRQPGRQPRLGLVWGGGRYLDGHARERDYRRKSLLGAPLLELLQALADRPIELVLLQVGPDRRQADPAGAIWSAQLDPQADFLELAQAMQLLDLVLCVDTAAAHLAGAMGLEAWLLLPWAAASRWQRSGSSSPWYPNLRLWRQPAHGDWRGLFPELLAALDKRWNSSP